MIEKEEYNGCLSYKYMMLLNLKASCTSLQLQSSSHFRYVAQPRQVKKPLCYSSEQNVLMCIQHFHFEGS